MNKKKRTGLLLACAIVVLATITYMSKKTAQKTTYKTEVIESIPVRRMGFYEKYIKRCVDVICALSAVVLFFPLYLGVAVLVKLKLGSPVFFVQDRPGLVDSNGRETIFKMYKFRTMTNKRGEDGELLPDEERLTDFGKWLRNTSLDELPEAWNILNGTMSVIGPRPQLVRDLTFMSKEQRKRHTAKPGLSGLAQINGRNNLDWEEKINLDLRYIDKISFFEDIRIIGKTVVKAFIKKEGITEGEMVTAEDFGDYLLRRRKIDKAEYENKNLAAKMILKGKNAIDDVVRINAVKSSAEQQKYSVLMSVYKKEKPEYLRMALDSMLNQTVPPDEIVLVEDGRLTDALYAVIEEYKKYLHIIVNETNKGLGLALNHGLNECRNELVARMDTDDISKPERCEKQLERFAQKPYLAIVGAHIDEFIGDFSHVVFQRIVPLSFEEIYEYAKRRSAFNHPVVMYSKTAVLKNGAYADLKRNQDVDLFGRMLFKGYKAENIDEALLWFRSSDELARRRKSWQNSWSYISVIRRFWKMGYSSFADYILVAAAQTAVYLMPVKMQNMVYKKLLRKMK